MNVTDQTDGSNVPLRDGRVATRHKVACHKVACHNMVSQGLGMSSKVTLLTSPDQRHRSNMRRHNYDKGVTFTDTKLVGSDPF